nr:unnamed protein product [Callosobruchus chinensis]
MEVMKNWEQVFIKLMRRYKYLEKIFQRIRTEKRKERAEAIKVDFQNDVPDVVTVHWDGKLLPALDARKSKEERLPILITITCCP